MQVMMILAIAMGAVSAWFWVIEARPGVKFLDENSYRDYGWKAIWLRIEAIPKFMPLIIDLTCTITLCSLFSLGGLMGTAMGLAMSNVISIAILVRQASKKKLIT